MEVYDCSAITGAQQSLRGLSRFHLRILSSRRAIWIKEESLSTAIDGNESIPMSMLRAVHCSLRRLEDTQFNRHRAWRICSGSCSRLRDVDIITVVSCCRPSLNWTVSLVGAIDRQNTPISMDTTCFILPRKFGAIPFGVCISKRYIIHGL